PSGLSVHAVLVFPGVSTVVQAFVTETFGFTGWMGIERTPQLHFDGEPGKTSLVVVPLPIPKHTWFDPGCRQVVQKGRSNFWLLSASLHGAVIVCVTNSGL